MMSLFIWCQICIAKMHWWADIGDIWICLQDWAKSQKIHGMQMLQDQFQSKWSKLGIQWQLSSCLFIFYQICRIWTHFGLGSGINSQFWAHFGDCAPKLRHLSNGQTMQAFLKLFSMSESSPFLVASTHVVWLLLNWIWVFNCWEIVIFEVTHFYIQM